MDNTIYAFATKPTKEGYIGYTTIGFDFCFTLMKEYIKNLFHNIMCSFTYEKPRHIKIWAIDDNEYSYNIYIENYED